jgi:hypothetical protein
MVEDLPGRITQHPWAFAVFAAGLLASTVIIALSRSRSSREEDATTLVAVAALTLQAVASRHASALLYDAASPLRSTEDPEKRIARIEDAVSLYIDLPLLAWLALCPVFLVLAWGAVSQGPKPTARPEAIACASCAAIAVASAAFLHEPGGSLWWFRAPLYLTVGVDAARRDRPLGAVLPLVVCASELMSLALGQLHRWHPAVVYPEQKYLFFEFMGDVLSRHHGVTLLILLASVAPMAWRTLRREEPAWKVVAVAGAVVFVWAVRDPHPFHVVLADLVRPNGNLPGE